MMHRYGSEPIEGLTVWGKWDSELYAKHNEDLEGEHGWSHFKSESLMRHDKIVLLASLEKDHPRITRKTYFSLSVSVM